MKKDFSKFEKNIGIEFNDKELLQQAFTHRSFLNENRGLKLEHNERLEFLGDAVLELITTDFLYKKYPDSTEGELTSYRSSLVRTDSISSSAREIGTNDFLLLSKGEAKDTGKARDYILANTFEAIIGAIYLDQGYDIAKEFISKTLFVKIDDIVQNGSWKDAKSKIQEIVQDKLALTPHYEVLSEIGPDHDRKFIVAIFFGEEKIAEGEGRSKQIAEQEAANRAMEIKGWK